MGYIYPDAEFRLAHTTQMRKAVRAEAEKIANKARARLAEHRETGASRIVVEQGDVDSHVILDDPAALSIEFGHGAYTTKNGRHVGASEPLYILRGSL